MRTILAFGFALVAAATVVGEQRPATTAKPAALSRDLTGTWTNATITRLERDPKYGERLASISGFYRNAYGRLMLNLPRGCALYGYRSRLGFYNGILCQPLEEMDTFFLLSSARMGGPKAIRMCEADEAFFKLGGRV